MYEIQDHEWIPIDLTIELSEVDQFEVIVS